MNASNRLVVVVGPTASGKSALAIWLAGRLSGEVLVCDSTQVYRHFNIGTAKVPAEEQHAIPHHLVDLVEPEELFTAGEYRRRALQVLENVSHRGKTPILVVGTGLYLRALLEGLADAPERSEGLRARLCELEKSKGRAHLHRMLARLDPEAARRIAPRDTQKVARALEICLLTAKRFTEVLRSARPALQGYAVQKVGLLPPRTELYLRIERRVDEMLQAGWLDEVKQLIDRGVSTATKPFQFIGYSELHEHLQGRISRDQAILRIKQATRHYAKRQITWFRKEPGVRWFAAFGDGEDLRKGVEACLRTQMELSG